MPKKKVIKRFLGLLKSKQGEAGTDGTTEDVLKKIKEAAEKVEHNLLEVKKEKKPFKQKASIKAKKPIVELKKKPKKETKEKKVKKTQKKSKVKKTIKKKIPKKKAIKPKKEEIKKKVVKKKTIKKKLKKNPIKKTHPLILKKHEENPILSPLNENKWESWQTFNPGAILLGDKIHFVYRAVGEDGMSRLGYASLSDFKIDKRHPYPVYEHNTSPTSRYTYYSYTSGGSWGGCEDPKIVQVKGENTLYMTYTACDGGLRVGLTSIKVKDFLKENWKWKPPKIISPPGELHKNWSIFPEKIDGKYAILHNITPEVEIEYFDNLDFKDKEFIKSNRAFGPQEHKSRGAWEKWVRGPGPPPVKTKDGWLLLYHAMDKDFGKYKVGAMLLDLKNPKKIITRSRIPILEPDEDYENNGCKSGIVYASGAIVKNDDLIVLYGGSDSYVCIAKTNLNKFLSSLKKGIKPSFKRKLLRKKS